MGDKTVWSVWSDPEYTPQLPLAMASLVMDLQREWPWLEPVREVVVDRYGFEVLAFDMAVGTDWPAEAVRRARRLRVAVEHFGGGVDFHVTRNPFRGKSDDYPWAVIRAKGEES